MGVSLGIIFNLQDDQEHQKHPKIYFLGNWSCHWQFLAILAIKEAVI